MATGEQYSRMKTILLTLFLAAVVLLAGCDKENSQESSAITVPNQEYLTQNVYADENTGKNDVTFTTTGAWTSEITESAETRSEQSAAVDWVSITPSSGDKAGNYTIKISLQTNYTGEKRSATISLKCSGETVRVVVTQEAVTATGDKPTLNPEPSGTGELKNETTGQIIELTKVKHSILDPVRVEIEFFGEKLYDGKEEIETWFKVEFANPLENGKLKPGTYKINFSGNSPHPNLKQGECYFSKSTIFYLETGTIQVKLDKETYKFTFDGITYDEYDEKDKITGFFTGVPEYLNEEIKVESIALDESAKTLEMGESFTLTATIMPENATNRKFMWSSDNTDVATVDDNGLVKSLSAGTATITATTDDGAKTASCVVTVNPPVAVESITVSPSELTLFEGETREFYEGEHVKILPENAYNKAFTSKSSDENVAVYTGKFVRAINAGTAVITFTTEDGAKTAKLHITVNKRETSGNGTLTETDPDGKYDEVTHTLIEAVHTVVSKNKAKVELKNSYGNTVMVLTFVNPLSGGRLAPGNYRCIQYENGENNIVTSSYYLVSGSIDVSVENDTYTFRMNDVKNTNGIVFNGSYTGELTYTNEYVEVSSVQLNQSSLVLTSGEYYTGLTATVLPENAFNKNLTWSSSNPNIASVNDYGGITAYSTGSVTITVTTEDGGHMSSCEVTVNSKASTGSGTFSNNNGQSVDIERAEIWINEKSPNKVELRFFKRNPASAYSGDVYFTLVRADNDTGTLKAGTYSVISNLSADELGIKYSNENTGAVTVSSNGTSYTIQLDATTNDRVKIIGTYTGILQEV